MLPASDLDKLFNALAGDRDGAERSDTLEGIDDAAALGEYLKSERRKLLERILPWDEGAEPPPVPVGGLHMAREFSDLMDAVMRRMFVIACRRVRANPDSVPMAIVATGGYGRRELAAFSDIDM